MVRPIGQMTLYDSKLETLARFLSPESPIRSTEYLLGRALELQSVEQELRFFRATPFIFGNRGVGKTSLARTVAQQVTSADREHVYVACAPGASMLGIFKEIALELLGMAVRLGDINQIHKKVELDISMNPGIKLSLERRAPELQDFENVNAAIRTIREIDRLLTRSRETVVIIDELEELKDADRIDLAYFIKQLGDQEIGVRFMLVGIAENVHELIGAHQSVPRYIKEVHLAPLTFQILMDIVKEAANQVDIQIDHDILIRIAIIGNGYPHFAHLMGKTILTEAAMAGAASVTPDIYKKGVNRAVNESIQELRISYEAATQRRDDIHKHLIWALANSDFVDLRIDDWIREYEDLARRLGWHVTDQERARSVISRLNQDEYGRIVINTPLRYGGREARYRYKRFSNNLMRGHVRLQAEKDGVRLGKQVSL